MADIAEVGFRADTDDLDVANQKMKALKPSAEAVEKASEKLTRKASKTNGAFRKLAQGGVLLNGTFGKLSSGGGLLNSTFGKLSSGVGDLVVGFKGMAVAAVAGFAFAAMIAGAQDLSGAVAELSTLLPVGSTELTGMQNAARKMADEFGTNAAFQIKAFYGAVSAGATDAAAAIDIVTSSNKLAIGGVTDVATGVDILTTATNAYAASGLLASSASDALFVGMKAGKTTIGELASGLGDVVPIAAALGVEFDELVAGTAALTLQGLSTSSAITSLRAILSGVAKPSGEAAKMAKKLGLDFSTTALRAKGLAGFLKDVVDKTGGSADQLSVMFGSVEALNAALAFAGAGGESFNEILNSMTEKAGATDEALKKIQNSLDDRFATVLNKVNNLAIDLGYVLLSVIVPAAEAVSAVFGIVSNNVDILVIAFIGLISTQIPSLVAGLALAVVNFNLGAAASIGFAGAVRVAHAALAAFGGPVGIIFALLSTAAATMLILGKNTGELEQPMYDAATGTAALNGELDVFYQNVGPAASTAVINLANDNYKLADSAYAAAKAELAKQKSLLQIASTSGVGGTSGSMKEMGLSPTVIQPQYESALARLTKAEQGLEQASRDRKRAVTVVTGSVSEIMTNGIKPIVKTTVAVDGLSNGLKKTAKAGKSAASGVGKTTEALTKLQQIAKDVEKISEPFNQAESAFTSIETAFDRGILTNEQYIESLNNIQDAFLKTGGSAEQWAKIVNGQTDNIAQKMDELGEQSLSRLGDELINLGMTGEASFGDMAKSIVKDLLKIMWQALVVQPILDRVAKGGDAGGGKGGGGFLSTLIKGAGMLFGGGVSANANGNAFGSGGVTPFAKGSAFANTVVSQSTPFSFAKGTALGEMGEAGPEAIMPLKRGANGSLGVQMYGGQNNSSPPANNNVNINNVYKVEGAVSEDKIMSAIRSQGEKTKEDAKQSLVGWMNEYEQNGTM